MKSRIQYAFFVILMVPFLCQARVTANEAQSLPLHKLAQKVLGEVGSLMIGVERPSWGSPPAALAGTPAARHPAGPPPLHQLQFFGKAIATGSQFGLCGADWVTVYFNKGGNVRKIHAARRYGVEGSIYREPGKWTYDEANKICKGVTSTRNYFPAPDSQSALEVALFIDAIHHQGHFSNQQFVFSCTGSCVDERSALNALQLHDIDEIRKIDCPPMGLKLPSCYEVVVGKYKVGPFPKTFKLYGSNYMNNVIIKAVKVHVSFSYL